MVINLNQTLPWKSPGPDGLAMLKDLQGSILKNHGRDHTLNLFLKFNNQAGARAWIKNSGVPLIPNQLQQLQDAEHHSADPSFSAPTFVELMLSRSGYQALGIPQNKQPADARFQSGMSTPLVIGANADPPAAVWEPHLVGPDAMLLIGAASAVKANAVRKTLKAAMGTAVTIIGEERGKALRMRGKGPGLENFGYVDGRSQPLMLQEDVIKEQNEGGGINLWDPAFPLANALVKDPGGATANSHGSYFVFRKLEQNVKAFQAAEDKLAEILVLAPGDEERAGAMIVGRFEDGTPLEMHNVPQANNPVWNNFNYDNDQAGSRCPFQAHVRKTNPRGGSIPLGGLAFERSHIMARRGITYGKRKFNLSDQPEHGVGLLFMAFMSNIANQFEFTQQSWANGTDFLKPDTGLDLVIGQPNTQSGSQSWPVKYDDPSSMTPATVNRGLAAFVTMLGGEYMFAPAISTLAAL